MIPFRYVPIIVWYRWILCWISRDRNTSKNPQFTEVSKVVHYSLKWVMWYIIEFLRDWNFTVELISMKTWMHNSIVTMIPFRFFQIQIILWYKWIVFLISHYRVCYRLIDVAFTVELVTHFCFLSFLSVEYLTWSHASSKRLSRTIAAHHTVTLIECKTLLSTLPPQGGFLFTMFPHQEPWVRGPPSKHLVQIFRGRSSYSQILMREHST